MEIVTINDIQKHNKIYDKNSKLNEMLSVNRM